MHDTGDDPAKRTAADDIANLHRNQGRVRRDARGTYAIRRDRAGDVGSVKVVVAPNRTGGIE